MDYIAVINVDFETPYDTNAYEKLKNALVQLGWSWVETSAFRVQTPDLPLVLSGIELVVKQAGAIGDVSALNYHVQGHNPGVTAKTPSTAANHPSALTEIRTKAWPG